MADNHQKKLLAVLNGIFRYEYMKETDITPEFLRQELYADLPEEAFNDLYRKCRSYIKSMAATDMDMNQAETFLTAQTKKAKSGFTEEQALTFVKFWKQNKWKIHECLSHQCKWDNQLQSIRWRIDVGSKAKNISEYNSSTAIVEMEVCSPLTKDRDKIQFEMDESNILSVLKELKEIDGKLNDIS